MLAVTKRLGIDALQVGMQYELQLKTNNGNQILSISGLTFTQKEKDAFSSSKLKEDVLPDMNNDVVEELGLMLQQSYQENKKLKDCKKLMQAEIKRLNTEIDFKERKIRETQNVSPVDKNRIHNDEFELLTNTLADMGVGRLECGVLYTVHFQAMNKTSKNLFLILFSIICFFIKSDIKK